MTPPPTPGPPREPASDAARGGGEPPAIDRAGLRRGQALVAAQFALVAVLAVLGGPALSGAWGGVHPMPVPVVAGWGLMLAAALLGGWALAVNRPGNFRIHPAPHPRGRLVERGPYRWIRHPMYAAVLAAGAGCALAAAASPGRLWLAGGAWFALAGVLVVKAALEERWLLARHPGYAAYRSRTRRFVPGLF